MIIDRTKVYKKIGSENVDIPRMNRLVRQVMREADSFIIHSDDLDLLLEFGYETTAMVIERLNDIILSQNSELIAWPDFENSDLDMSEEEQQEYAAQWKDFQTEDRILNRLYIKILNRMESDMVSRCVKSYKASVSRKPLNER